MALSFKKLPFKKIAQILKQALLGLKSTRRAQLAKTSQKTKAEAEGGAKSLESFGICPLDKDQLKNLIYKNISFAFFYIGAKPANTSKERATLLQKAVFATEEEALSLLKEKDKSQPVVLVCATGGPSAQLSKALAQKGFLNVCFLKEGIESL